MSGISDHGRSMSPADFELSLRLPLLGVWVSNGLWEQGIGHVIVARRGSGGKVLFVDFLVDVYCLGIKDLSLACEKESRFKGFLSIMDEQLGRQVILPAHARKLLEGAVAYAESLGFPPPGDARKALRLLHDSDPATCETSFAYGKQGAPFYVSGPNDSAERRQQIVATLERSCGAGNFHFLVQKDDSAAS